MSRFTPASLRQVDGEPTSSTNVGGQALLPGKPGHARVVAIRPERNENVGRHTAARVSLSVVDEHIARDVHVGPVSEASPESVDRVGQCDVLEIVLGQAISVGGRIL